MLGCVLLRFTIPGWVMCCLGRQCLVLCADVSSNAASRLCVLALGTEAGMSAAHCEFELWVYPQNRRIHTSLYDQRALRCTECQAGCSGRHSHTLKNNNRHTYRISHARQFICKHIHHSTPAHAVCKSISINNSCLYTHHMTDNSIYIYEQTLTHTRRNVKRNHNDMNLKPVYINERYRSRPILNQISQNQDPNQNLAPRSRIFLLLNTLDLHDCGKNHNYKKQNKKTILLLLIFNKYNLQSISLQLHAIWFM